MKLGRICFLIFILIFGFGCDKSVDTDDELKQGSGGGGVGKGTLISMADGKFERIEGLKIGDKVASNNGSAREIQNIVSGTIVNIFSITTKPGNSILIGGGHPIESPDGLITAGELKVGMLITGKNGNEIVDRIIIQPYNGKIYNLQFKEETYLVANGFVIGDFDIFNRISSRE